MSKFEFIGDGGDGKPKWLRFPCQGREGGECMIALRPHQKNSAGASWEWDGNKERPTITPSINCKDCWHGWIRNGEFVTA